MIRKSGREDELVHPPVFTFAAWHQMRQHQTEQQTDAQHTAAVHKPLHDNGALFIIKLQICRIHLLLRDNQLVFNFWFSSFNALITLSLPATFFCISAVRWFRWHRCYSAYRSAS